MIYEFIVQWLREDTRLRNLDEVLTFLQTYFTPVNSLLQHYVRVVTVKVRGDECLRDAESPELRARKLSLCDAIVIVLAKEHKAPMVMEGYRPSLRGNEGGRGKDLMDEFKDICSETVRFSSNEALPSPSFNGFTRLS